MNIGNNELATCMEDYWEFFLRHNPLFATYIGDHRYDDKLEDASEESLAAEAVYYGNLLDEIRAIDRDLKGEDRLNTDLLTERLESHLRFYRFGTHFLPLNHMDGPHVEFPQIVDYHPFTDARDFENYLARLQAFPVRIDQVIMNLKKGSFRGMTQFRKSIDYVISQVEAFSRPELDEGHPLLNPIRKLPPFFSLAEREEIGREIRAAVSSAVTPAYGKLLKYLKEEYSSSCRRDPGIWSVPKGEEMYRAFVRHHTTTDLSPEEIHEIGLKEVSRIGGEIKGVLARTGFRGAEREFVAGLKGNTEFYPEQAIELREGFREILRRVDCRLPAYFGRLPRAGYDIREIEKYREEAAPAAYYYPPPRDFSRPGIFYVNTYHPEERPKFTMEALAYHEAVPGHHLQISLMQEREGLPEFRRYGGSTALIEGWALYAEKLAEEMGLYTSLYALYGRLTFEMWRAVRLVVDTGIHFFRWSREQSINYCLENTALDDHEIETEVDRYAVMPGQALAYKIGELKIFEIREKAKKVLRDEFDIREFHDRLLEHGALPLFALEESMDRWINSREGKTA